MKYFKEHFGLLNPDGTPNTKKANEVSSNVVSVLQAGAFFGALGSAPISGELRFVASGALEIFRLRKSNDVVRRMYGFW